jgi:predicted peroxiredoxin
MATIPFVMATTALAMDKEVVMAFQSRGVLLMKKGIADHVVAADFPVLADLLSAYIEGGGQMHVCSPCMQTRKIKEEELVEGAKVIGAATFISECLGATNIISY